MPQRNKEKLNQQNPLKWPINYSVLKFEITLNIYYSFILVTISTVDVDLDSHDFQSSYLSKVLFINHIGLFSIHLECISD